MKPFSILATSLVFSSSAVVAVAAEDCVERSVSIRHAVQANESAVLEVVEREVGANAGCACEIVKAAIETTKAEPELVAAIVETAAMTAPEQMRLVAQCAVAVAPDALSEVQAVLIRLEPSSGEATGSGKAKDGSKFVIEAKPQDNPLDFPAGPDGSPAPVVAPSPGTWGGSNPISVPVGPPGGPNPPIVRPPVGTKVDFGNTLVN